MSDTHDQDNDSPSAGATTGASTPSAGASAGSTPSADEVATLREQMLTDRFDAVAARAGIDESHTEVALELFRKTGTEPTRENLAAFCSDLKKSVPSHVQVSPAPPTPPNSTVRWRAASYAIACAPLASGESAGVRISHRTPSHSAVSFDAFPENMMTR